MIRRVYIPRESDPVWSLDRVGDAAAALLIVIGGCFAAAWGTLL